MAFLPHHGSSYLAETDAMSPSSPVKNKFLWHPLVISNSLYRKVTAL